MAKLSKRAGLIRALHDKGLTYEEIGELFGITRQAAHQAASAGDGFHESSVTKVKYEGLRRWMQDNRVSFSELERRCGSSKLHKTLTGDCEPRKKTIDNILQVTGLTYEECFKEDQTHDQN